LIADKARFARPARALGEIIDDLLDLRHRRPFAQKAVKRIFLVGRRQSLRVLDAVDVALAPAVAQLQDELAVVLVHGLADGTPERDVTIVIDHRVVRDDAAAQVDRDER
jgi:hypothetical protein